MTIEALRVLLHEVRLRVDKAPVRSSMHAAIVGELLLACQVVDLAETFDEVRAGLFRGLIELAVRNVLARRELAGAHDAARRALRCVLATGDARHVEAPPPSPLDAVDVAALDLGLALVHLRDVAGLAHLAHDYATRGPSAGRGPTIADLERAIDKLEGVERILVRLHDATEVA